jgi:Trypsin
MKIDICSRGLAAGLAAGCAGAPGAETSTELIIAGQQDYHRTSVVMIAGVTTCTGTYVGSGIVLTAEHCVPLASSGEAVSVTFVDYVRGTQQTLASTRYDAMDAGAAGLAHAARDLARILIDDAAVPEGITAMPVLDGASGVLGGGDLGAKLTAVGFGVTIPPTTDRPGGEGHGTRFQGPVTLEMLDADIAGVSRDAGDAVPCGGDSGGPLLVVRGSTEYLAGVLSDGDCETSARYTRADSERAVAFLERDLDCGPDCDGGGGSDPALGGRAGCRSAASPGGLALFGLWLAAVLWRRGRRVTARGRTSRSR